MAATTVPEDANFEDTYFWDADTAIRTASQKNMVITAAGSKEPQVCYFNGPKLEIIQPNLVCVPYMELSTFFLESEWRSPTRLHMPPNLTDQQGKELHSLFQGIISLVKSARKNSHKDDPEKLNPIPRNRHAFFFCRDTALRVALENNQVQSGTVGGFETQQCYFDGESFADPPSNLVRIFFADLIALPYRAVPDFLATIQNRYPSALYWPNQKDGEDRQVIQRLFSSASLKARTRGEDASYSLVSGFRTDIRLISESLLNQFYPDVENRLKNPDFVRLLTIIGHGDYSQFFEWTKKVDVPSQIYGNLVLEIFDAFIGGKKRQGIALFEVLLGLVHSTEKQMLFIKKLRDFFGRYNMKKDMRSIFLRVKWNDQVEQDYFDSFTCGGDLECLLDIQGRLAVEVNLPDEELAERARRIGARIQKWIDTLTKDESVLKTSQACHNANVLLLKKIDPTFSDYADRLHFGPEVFELMLNHGGSVYYKHQGIWWRLVTEPEQTNAKRPFWSNYGEGPFFFRGDSVGEMARMMLSLKTEASILFQDYCYLLMPLSWLNALMASQDLSYLEKATHIIRWVDEFEFSDSLAKLYSRPCHAFSTTIRPDTNANAAFRTDRLLPVHTFLMERFNQLIYQNITDLHSLYAPNFSACIPTKVRNRSLRIFFITSKFTTFLQYCIRDLSEGFTRLGYACFVHKEGDREAMTNRAEGLVRDMLEFKPDVIVQICYLRYSIPAIPGNIPFVSWIQDILGHVANGDFVDRITNNDIILSEMHHDELELNGYTNFIKFPTLANDRIFNIEPEVDNFESEISFVAHYSDQVPFAEESVNDFVRDILENTILTPEDNPQHGITRIQDYIDILEPHLKRVFPQAFFNFQSYRSISRTYGNSIWRHKILRWIIEDGHNLDIYGRDWDRCQIYQPFAKGPIPHGTGSSQIYNRSKINLQLNPFTTLHHRVFEVIGSGGFLLLGKINPDKDLNRLTDYLKEGEGYVFFDGRKDLTEKIKYYLKNSRERIEIAQKGRDLVVKEYNYVNGARKVLDVLSNRFDQRQD